MSEDTFDKDEKEMANLPEKEEHSDYKPVSTTDEAVKHQLSGMYQNWFLDYASYVILERAVPHINDGLKPVQRRILHSMKRLDDGRYNKVANIVGHTMQFHPHGDASIGDALVQLGQKDLLIDCQGNWGNILTGDSAAASRYIEARLSKFALDVVFNPKTTEWQASYDGRNREPVTLPVKFPLLLTQGVEGIAVGLSSKILPHNFNELCDAAIAYLHGEDFQLYPDFQTGGSIDVSRYNDGERGGVVRVRAKISKIDNKTLCISEIPYGKTTSSLIDSILKAISKYIEENAGLKKQMEEFMKEKEAAVKNKLIEGAKEINGVKVIKAVLPMPADAVKNIAFQLKGQFTENLFVVIGSVFENKPLLTVTMSEDQVKAGLNAGQLVREAAKLIQGGGGGQPHFATAGGKNPDGLNTAVDKVVELAGF
jgi:DNA gyrase/topoisomerase IV subunit A